MKKQVLFIQGGGQGAYEEDRKLAALNFEVDNIDEAIDELKGKGVQTTTYRNDHHLR
jgi:hypothetical protein